MPGLLCSLDLSPHEEQLLIQAGRAALDQIPIPGAAAKAIAATLQTKLDLL